MLVRSTIIAIGCLAFIATARADDSALLKQRMQTLVDAVSNGDPKPWAAYLADGVSFTDENGTLAGKKAMVAQVVPLPKGISGTIKVIDWQADFFGQTAITTHIEDEFENFHGQHLHAQYRATNAWVKQKGDWKIVGAQIIALQQDPPETHLPAARLADYVGTYRAGPDLNYLIRKGKEGLEGCPEGGKWFPVRFEIADVTFAEGQPRVRKLFQRNPKGQVIGFLSRREGRDVVWTRVSSP
ncbi:MAG TPA: nuclear transport factor 2 family protein [Rhizomicrobium sp.]|jgi:ketosteroid isomerase-like protein